MPCGCCMLFRWLLRYMPNIQSKLCATPNDVYLWCEIWGFRTYKMGKIGFGVNHFRFYGESEMIHLC